MLLSGNDIKAAVNRHTFYRDLGKHRDPRDIETEKAYSQPRLVISDFDESRLNPNSYNLRLASELLVYMPESRYPDGSLSGRAPGLPTLWPSAWYPNTPAYLDTRSENPTVPTTIPTHGLILEPGVLYLGQTMEYTETHNCAPFIEGRSSIGRLGMSIHVTAGFGDVGFCGTWTLEITVVHPVQVYPGLEVCQICYSQVTPGGPTYKGRYQGQREPVASRLHLKKENA